jgi:uncharacterized protein YqgV (UPF0045/DUF77 family)
MEITVEISLYPLQKDYGNTVLSFIAALKEQGLTLRSNHMSTQIRGTLDEVMPALTEAIREILSEEQKAAIVVKMFNDDVDLEWLPEQ